jgi:hypothetical protein
MTLGGITHTLSSFPTAIFTGILIFCLAWWLITLLVAGLDADVDLDADGPDFLGFGHMPIALALTLLSFGAWAASLVLSTQIDDVDAAGIGTVLGIAAAALVVGAITLRVLSRPLSRLFHTEHAPERAATVGATCKVRTLHVDERFGDAEVINGVNCGSLIRVRAGPGQFHRGDLAHVIDFDEATESFTISELADELRP